jgi:Holliday junction DNA helicase RuvA
VIDFIKGILVSIKTNSVVIDNNGIGYEIFCPLNDIASLSTKKDTEILLYTQLFHKEDSMTLYGFISENTRKAFLNLLKVGGIGPKMAVKILSFYDLDVLYKSIEEGDVDSLTGIPGIGQKIAKQIVFDLKGIIVDAKKDKTMTPETAVENDLILAMINLGYKESDIKNKLKDLKPLSYDFETEFKKLIKAFKGNK